jgi:hypothetical protein
MSLSGGKINLAKFEVEWIENPYYMVVTAENEDRVREPYREGIVLLPGRNTIDKSGLYGGETPRLYKTIKLKHPTIKIEIFDNTENINEEHLHSADIIMPILEVGARLIENIGISFFAKMIYDYVKSRVRIGEEKETKVFLNIFIAEDEQNKVRNIKYDGPVDGLKQLEKILKEK